MRPFPFVFVLISLTLIGCGVEPSSHEASVVSARGLPLKGGEQCRIDIVPAQKLGVNCQIDIVCEGTRLFGGKRWGGYAPCEKDAEGFTVSAQDPGITSKNGDPALALDFASGHIEIWDRSWRAELETAR